MISQNCAFELALIPARGGSKGLAGKNIRQLGSAPLIAWTIAAAQKSKLFRHIVVSTDDLEIANVSRAAGASVPFMRPSELANDTATSASVVAHAIATLGITGAFAVLQPTSPFRQARHLREAATIFDRLSDAALYSVIAGKPLNWAMYKHNDLLVPACIGDVAALRRQDARKVLYPNGAIYMMEAKRFMKTETLPASGIAPYEMTQMESIDIDSADDFSIAAALASAKVFRIDHAD